MAEMEIDVRGQTCPVPLVECRKALKKASPGDLVIMKGTHPASKKEIPMACEAMGLKVLDIEDKEGGRERVGDKNKEISPKRSENGEKTVIILHSGDMDKIYSALIIANGALAMGMEASIYFTFWGLMRLKKGELNKGPLSKMNMLGLGRQMIKKRMDKANVASLERLMNDFKELGGKVIACEMTMEIMGLSKEELQTEWIDEWGAVGSYIQEARNANITLFI